MGCDGGTIPKRHELVKGPKKAEKVDKNAELAARWNYCSLSQERLTKPIVACDLGRLYNKDALIEFLLDKSPDKPHGSAAHIKSIKNVIELNLTDNPAWSGDKSNAKGDAYEDWGVRFICPVVGLEMNGRHRFCVLRHCGCVFSERALKEIRTDICHKCGKKFEEDDIILLNGDKEEMEELRRKMEERRLKSKMEKKTKKSKSAKSVPQSQEEPSGSKEITTGEKSSSGDQMNVGTNSKRSADDGSGSLEKTSRSSSSTSKRSLQDDDGKSEAYKSIFSSHSSAKRTKDQACNWISPSTFYI